MLIDKNSIPLVAMEFMNEVHMEDIEIINTLFELLLAYKNERSDENKEMLNKKYEEWYEHTLEHFKNEEIMMQERDFPPYPFHKGEHDKALSIMDEKYRSWKQNENIEILEDYFTNELPVWLRQHIESMDTVTAMFFKTGLSPCAVNG